MKLQNAIRIISLVGLYNTLLVQYMTDMKVITDLINKHNEKDKVLKDLLKHITTLVKENAGAVTMIDGNMEGDPREILDKILKDLGTDSDLDNQDAKKQGEDYIKEIKKKYNLN
jgi:hypothetical protein